MVTQGLREQPSLAIGGDVQRRPKPNSKTVCRGKIQYSTQDRIEYAKERKNCQSRSEEETTPSGVGQRLIGGRAARMNYGAIALPSVLTDFARPLARYQF